MQALSLRLKTIASLVPNGARVCDVGTDHARLPIYLKQSGIANTVIATDLNEKPLKNAEGNIRESGVTGISLRLCDGLSGVQKSEVDTVIVAGIGGEVISGILNNCLWLKADGIILILQPTTSPEMLRKFLVNNGFDIINETPVYENGKIYSIIKARFSGNCSYPPESFYYIGKIPKTDAGITYIQKQQKRIFDYIKAFEKLSDKQDEYNFFKAIYDDINHYLTENI